MKIQIVKFDLTPDESAQALPLMISAIAGSAPTDFSPIAEVNPFQEEPSEGFEGFLKALPATPPPTEPASPVPASIIRIAAPTGSPNRAKSMVWDGRAKRYVRRALSGRLALWVRSLGTSLSTGVQKRPGLSAITVGLLLGSMAFWLLVRTGLVVQLAESFKANRLAEVVQPKKKNAPAAPKAAPEPGDASSKSGVYGKKPPMQPGVLED